MIASVGPGVPPPELGLGREALPRISIFMSVFDCHVNRAPVAGRISKIVYRAGLFINADLDKASEDNERNGLIIDAPRAGSGSFRSLGSSHAESSVSSRPGDTDRGRRALRPDPLRLAGRCLSAACRAASRRGGRAGDRRRDNYRRFPGPRATPRVQAKLDMTRSAWLLAVRRFRDRGSALCWAV